jgi:hypothetical protein
MKRAGLWAIGIGALVSAGPLTVEQAYSWDQGGPTSCSNATLKGVYMSASSGYTTLNGSLVPIGVAGKDIIYGNGKFDSLVTISIGGNIIPDDAAPGTYTVNSDCTGTFTVNMTPPTPDVHLDIFVAPDGSEYFTIQTDPGNVLPGTIPWVAR